MIEVKRMWPNGPLRRWSVKPHSGWIPYGSGGYAGPYVCSECGKDVPGVYSPNWLCGTCRAKSKASGKADAKPLVAPETRIAAC
jgi:hypothetical protein